MSRATNTADEFGWVSRAFHWIMALGVIGALMFGTFIARMEVPNMSAPITPSAMIQ